MSWQTILAIGSGGFLGAILRAYINGSINNSFPHALPFGTLGVNILGSFILGSLFAFFTYTAFFSIPTKSFLSTGLMGALTTYSTFAYETFLLLQGGSFIYALINICLNVVGTITFAGIGYKIFQILLK